MNKNRWVLAFDGPTGGNNLKTLNPKLQTPNFKCWAGRFCSSSRLQVGEAGRVSGDLSHTSALVHPGSCGFVLGFRGLGFMVYGLVHSLGSSALMLSNHLAGKLPVKCCVS